MAIRRGKPTVSKNNYGLPVADAKKDLILHITENDIRGGKRSDNDFCAAANALCRQEGFKAARIFKTMTYVYNDDGSVTRYVTPDSLYLEIMVYDRGGRFIPGDHRLKAPRGVMRLGSRDKPKGKGGKTGKLPRAVHNIINNVREDAPKGIKSLKSLFGEE
jgi:hypothetical protein